MLRIIGCVLTVICTALWGVKMSRTLKEKEKMTASMCAFIKNCGDKIELLCLPLSRIFAEYDDIVLTKSGFMEVLLEKGGEIAVSDYSESFIPGADKLMQDFFTSLGDGDRQSEVNLCRAVYRELSERLSEFRESLPGKMRIYRILPLMLSLCAVILII